MISGFVHLRVPVGLLGIIKILHLKIIKFMDCKLFLLYRKIVFKWICYPQTLWWRRLKLLDPCYQGEIGWPVDESLFPKCHPSISSFLKGVWFYLEWHMTSLKGNSMMDFRPLCLFYFPVIGIYLVMCYWNNQEIILHDYSEMKNKMAVYSRTSGRSGYFCDKGEVPIVPFFPTLSAWTIDFLIITFAAMQNRPIKFLKCILV